MLLHTHACSSSAFQNCYLLVCRRGAQAAQSSCADCINAQAVAVARLGLGLEEGDDDGGVEGACRIAQAVRDRECARAVQPCMSMLSDNCLNHSKILKTTVLKTEPNFGSSEG